MVDYCFSDFSPPRTVLLFRLGTPSVAFHVHFPSFRVPFHTNTVTHTHTGTVSKFNRSLLRSRFFSQGQREEIKHCDTFCFRVWMYVCVLCVYTTAPTRCFEKRSNGNGSVCVLYLDAVHEHKGQQHTGCAGLFSCLFCPNHEEHL